MTVLVALALAFLVHSRSRESEAGAGHCCEPQATGLKDTELMGTLLGLAQTLCGTTVFGLREFRSLERISNGVCHSEYPVDFCWDNAMQALHCMRHPGKQDPYISVSLGGTTKKTAALWAACTHLL